MLIACGVLLLADVGLTLAWQEPVSAIYASTAQSRLSTDLLELELAKPEATDVAVLRNLATKRRIAFLARRLRLDADRGAAVGRIAIATINASFVVVDGADSDSLRSGPGIYDDVPFPGAPGTTAIAGHRTTYRAPFRRIDRIRRGHAIVVEMPYGRFTYEVEKTRIVPPTQLSVIRRVSYDRLVLSACHPLYSAKQRIVVFARLVDARARGAARI